MTHIPIGVEDAIWAIVICTGCSILQIFSHNAGFAKLILPIAGPPLGMFLGREAHRTWPWQVMIWPVCAILGFLGFFYLVFRNTAPVKPDIPSAAPVPTVWMASAFEYGQPSFREQDMREGEGADSARGMRGSGGEEQDSIEPTAPDASLTRLVNV